ncbi:MAG: (d)CMP kinase [Nitrospinae bacterium]|nr:(d)CMP kinase [Nitrospinota bacterium]
MGAKKGMGLRQRSRRKSAGIVIPVDGPAGSGKSTAAKGIAERLGFDYLESGALYRAVGYRVLKKNREGDFENLAVDAARDLRFECRKEGSDWKNILDGEDVTDALRDEDISDMASRVSAIPGVREALLDFQRNFGRERGAVIDGRDIGTVVFPEAGLKFFLDADIEVRIERRFAELQARGVSFHPDRLREDLKRRDERDRHRTSAPLRKAEDAEEIDTSGMGVDQMLEVMLEKIRLVYGEVIEDA